MGIILKSKDAARKWTFYTHMHLHTDLKRQNNTQISQINTPNDDYSHKKRKLREGRFQPRDYPALDVKENY
jgi:hypothetical protein